jgi:ATP-dependent RNA helicase DeaD
LIALAPEEAVTEADASFASMRVSADTLAALARMGIDTPTPIQAEALPALLDGRDLIGQARTGSGKTLAFGIPAIELVDTRQRHVQVLVLTPTRELAVQVGGVLEELGAAKGIKVGLLFGGRAPGPQREMLKRGAQIIVGTPGRVLDFLQQGALWLDKIRLLVLDEADEMLDFGFAPDVERIMSRATPDRQTVLFSATVPDWVRKTADRHLDRPITVTVDPNPEDAAPIEHIAYDVADGNKIEALKDLLDHRGDGSVIVFGRTKHGVRKLARKLAGDGYPVADLQGNLSQNARDRVMADFRSGDVPILLATNVAARGLDVTHVAQVINVELPESSQLLTHRIGRTGRMGRQGQAITLLGPDDGKKWRQLERSLGRRVPRAPWRGAIAALDSEAEEPSTLVARPRPPAPASTSEGTVSGRPRRSRRGGRDRLSAPVGQPHRVQCSACGQTAEVPFEPDPTRPVYCADCYRQKHARRSGGTRRPVTRPDYGQAAGFVERDQ